jgi:hypothetical protein
MVADFAIPAIKLYYGRASVTHPLYYNITILFL